MNGAEVILEHANEEGEDLDTSIGKPIFLSNVPSCLLLRAVGVKWTLPASILPKFSDKDYDRTGLFLLYPATNYIKRTQKREIYICEAHPLFSDTSRHQVSIWFTR